jgi:DNA (cytosine-5)-methyltransferase 3A
MIGGSPCQDLSIAKKDRQGLSGSRSGLFWEYVRIRDEVKPKYFILENVASMPKEAKDTISEALGVQPVMINASLVSAQNRKRLFWVGKWNGEKYEQVEIPQPDDRGILLKDILEESVDGKYFLSERLGKTILNWGETQKLKGNSFKANIFNNGSLTKSETLKATYHKIQGDGTYIMQYRRTYWRENNTGKVPTLTSNMGTGGNNIPYVISNKKEIRKLTPTECLRLQSMPDDYFDKATYKGKPISNTQRYKMCGNAFNKEVIKHILEHLEE